ncbi:MAG: nucleotidyltransferase domain-containing protein [archaeon GB-1867-035]|nr:nucleotidyltransferase domain-containing protein [Candidatus Culexmicrobium profundum]
MLRNIPEKVVNAIEKLIKKLSEKIRIQEVYLFGSYAKGTWIKTSDIDLIVISPDFKQMKFTERLDFINYIIWKEKISPYIEVIPLTPEELEVKKRESILISDASKHWIKLKINRVIGKIKTNSE